VLATVRRYNPGYLKSRIEFLDMSSTQFFRVKYFVKAPRCLEKIEKDPTRCEVFHALIIILLP